MLITTGDVGTCKLRITLLRLTTIYTKDEHGQLAPTSILKTIPNKTCGRAFDYQ